MRAIFVLLTLTAATLGMAADNVPVQNASFEDAVAGDPGPAGPDWEKDGAPPGWHHWIGSTARPFGPVLTWEKTGGRTGDRCVSLTRCGGPVCVIQSVPVEPGQTYVVRTWGRTDNPKSECYFSVRWQDADGKWTGNQLADRLTDETPPGEWGEMEVAAVAPDTAALLVILLTANSQSGDDKCWFDDVSVERLGPGELFISPCGWVPFLNPEGEPPETPHVKWARPWAAGSLRVLFLLGSDHSLREHIELAQRMEIEYDYALAHEFDDVLYALNPRQVMSRLREGWYDVVVVALKLPAAKTAGLLDIVGADGGVVLVDCPNFHPKLPDGAVLTAAEQTHYLMRSAGALPVVDQEGHTALAGISYAEGLPGRLVQVKWSLAANCLTPNHSYEEHLRFGAGYQEGYLQTLIRAILWAGRKEPAQAAAMTATQNGATLQAGGACARVWVSDRLSRVCGETTVDVLRGPVAVALPPGCASGPAMFSAIISNERGQVLDFASCRVNIEREASIAQVRSAREWFAEGEPVSVVVETAGAVAGMQVEAVLTDIYGRETARATVPAQVGETPIELPMRDHLSTVNWVMVRLLAGGEERDAARGYVLAPMDRQPWLEDFRMGTWTCTGYHPGYLHDAFVSTMRRVGIEAGLDGPAAYLPDLAGGVWPVSTAYGATPGFSRFSGPATEREPCLSDPAIRAKTAEVAEQVAAGELAFRPIFGYIRDETSLVKDDLTLDTCSSVHCQKRYRQWLAERYATIADLNAEWGTGYASFADTGFVTCAQARKQDNLAPWLMYRRFMDWVWADAVKWVSANARKADPGAMCALANSFGQAPFSGRDYELLADANDYTMEYPYEAWATTPWTHHFEAVRSFSPDVVHHPWIGYRHMPEAVRYEPWWCALHGASGVTVYGAMSVFVGKNSWAQIFPTLQITERGRMFAEVCRPLQRGIGKALMNATRPRPEIAILWSQPGLYAAWGLSPGDDLNTVRGGMNAYRQYHYSRDAFRRAIISTGRQFNYLSEGQILAGGLSGYRCLVLPGCFAIGPELCEVLRAFVEGGGRLIADQGVGLLNGVGARYQDSGPVAELFGIERTDRALAHAEVQVECASPFGGTLSLPARGHEKLSPVEGAPAWEDGSPMLVSRTVGRGRTVFLNFAPEEPAGLRPLFEGMSRLAVISAEGRDPQAYEVVRLDRGELHYYGILNDYRLEESGPITVQLQAEAGRHLYDVITHTHLGARDSVELTLAPGETALLATAPYQVDGISLVGVGRVAPGEACAFRLKVLPEQGMGDHVLRMTVTDPSGNVARHYCKNLLTVAGQADVSIPFAPNDATGAWTVVARDLISGACMEARIEVR